MKYLLLCILFLVCFDMYSQETEKPEVKVGLVLSGGGAKGLAHIGVLKVIDSLGVKIDYVAGTSMGAIIGALYASGYSGQQLDSIFHEIDFDNLINDELPRTSKGIYERNNSEKYAITLPFENLKIKLPSALSRGQNTFSLFSRLTLHVNEINDFSKLPIPFFCIATNVETGEGIILDKGNLTQSILASGALPTLFQPVNINNQLLIDGGVVNNYPIDELRAKGMAVIIGVDVQDGLATREDLTSALDILSQLNNFRTIHDMKSKIKKTDIYIKPNIKDYSVISFKDGEKIIDNGKQASILKLDLLKLLPKKEAVVNQTTIKTLDSITIKNIEVKGVEKYSRAYVLGKLKLKSDQKISYQTFNRGINNLVATNNFDSFEYELKANEDGEGFNLITKLRETKTSTFLKLAVHYDNLYKSAALVNFTKKRWLFDNDVTSLDVILGDHLRYNFEYFIDKGFYWSIGLKSRYHEFNKNINAQLILNDAQIAGTGLNKVDVVLEDHTNQMYVQTLFRKDFALSLGGEHKRLAIKTETFATNDLSNEFILEKTDYFSVFGGLKLDTYDNKYFPKRGVYFIGDLHMYLYASRFNTDFKNFSIAKADMGYAFSVSNKLAFNLQTSGGFKMGDKSTTTQDFALGGFGNNLINNFIPFLGYDFISLTGNSYVKASFSADYEFLRRQHILLEGNWANIDDDIFETGEWFTLPDYRGYAIGYGLDSFIGPVQIKYSYSPEQSQSNWFFNLGYWF